MLLAFLIATLIVFSINSLASIYLLSIKINNQNVKVSDLIIVFVALGMLSWNIYTIINL
jgi:hypothetical protein